MCKLHTHTNKWHEKRPSAMAWAYQDLRDPVLSGKLLAGLRKSVVNASRDSSPTLSLIYWSSSSHHTHKLTCVWESLLQVNQTFAPTREHQKKPMARGFTAAFCSRESYKALWSQCSISELLWCYLGITDFWKSLCYPRKTQESSINLFAYHSFVGLFCFKLQNVFS